MRRALGAMVVYLATLTPAVVAQSLWPPSGGSMFIDRRASQVGDPVTIVVEESISGSTSRRSASGKTIVLDLLGGSGLLSILPPAGFEVGSETAVQRSATVRGTLSARITVRVSEVLPNDLLKLHGARDVLVNNEPYRLVIEGVIRRVDIEADNTISAERIADARIVLDGTSAVPGGTPTRRGPLRFIIDGFRALLRLFF